MERDIALVYYLGSDVIDWSDEWGGSFVDLQV